MCCTLLLTLLRVASFVSLLTPVALSHSLDCLQQLMLRVSTTSLVKVFSPLSFTSRTLGITTW